MASKSIIATRMALLSTKKKIKLATKGHKLLKEKRDALISEFFSIVDELKTMRKEAEAGLQEAFRSLILAQAVSGFGEVRRAALAAKQLPRLTTRQKTIMGLRVPLFELEPEPPVTEYSLVSTTVELDEAVKKFKKVLQQLVKIAEKEAAVETLAADIKKTKRKVNALEQILLPRLEAEKSYITMRLEEMDRETFSRLKIIKSKIAQ